MALITLRHSRAGLLYNYLRHGYYLMRMLPKLFGTSARTCNACGHRGRFLAFGMPPRFDARCPSCGSLERHRLVAFWFQENEERLRGASLLHFAPDEKIARFVSERVARYQSADIAPGKADITLNIEQIDLPDASVDIIICSHVLEHVDDAKALRELRRILRPGGLALLMFPIVEGWPDTLDEKTLGRPVRTDADRVAYFGQRDHVRIYGRDVRDRIRAAGFELHEYVATEPRVSDHALLRGETIFIAEKKA